MSIEKGRSAIPKVKAGWFLYYKEQIYHVVATSALEVTVVRHGGTSLSNEPEEVIFGVFELYARDPDSKTEPIFAATEADLHHALLRRQPALNTAHPDGLPKNLLKEAREIINNVKFVESKVADKRSECQQNGSQFRRVPVLEEACRQLGIARSTYYHQLKIYKKNKGDSNKIAAALRRKDYNQDHQSRSVLHFVDTCIMRLNLHPSGVYETMKIYLERTGNQWVDVDACDKVPDDLVEELLNVKIDMSDILKNSEKAKLLTKIKLPSRSWFFGHHRWFRNLPESGREYITAVYGSEAWEREYMLFDTFVRKASLPLQYVFADHWWIDVITVDEATREKTQRLWLTVLIDAYTRCPLGIALLHEHPCIESIQTGLHNAIWPKENFDELDLKTKWPCFGIPIYLSLDNAWAHHSASLEELAHAIGQGGEFNSIELDFRRPYTGRYGAIIERFFGNLSRRIKEALKKAGAISARGGRPMRSARQEACLLYKDIYRIILEIIVDYMHKPHAELDGMTPYQKWVSAIDESGFPILPSHTPEIERLFWRYNPRECAITSKGICAFGMEYTSKQLQKHGRSGNKPSNVKYHYSYDVDNISRLALFQNGKYLFDVASKDLRLPDGTVQQVSLAEMELAKDIARSQGKPISTWYKFLGHELVEIVRRRRAEQRNIAGGNSNIEEVEIPDSDDKFDNGRLINENEDGESEENMKNLLGFSKIP